MNQQQLDGYSQIVENARRRKGAFEKKVVASSCGLRRFIPRDGTSLREAQRPVEEALGLAEEKADVEVEDAGVASEKDDQVGPK